MTPDLNHVLEAIREKMGEELEKLETAEGPETQEVGSNSHLKGTAGEGGAENVQDANDAVDKFLSDIADQLVLSAGMDEDAAYDFIFKYLDSVDEKKLSEIPDEDADPEELIMWLGKATTMGISAKIVKAAQGG